MKTKVIAQIKYNPYPPITIRQAKWISRLFYVSQILDDENARNKWLWSWSRVYAINERANDIIKKLDKKEKLAAYFDTTELDRALWRGDNVEIVGNGFFINDPKNKTGFIVNSDQDFIENMLKDGETK